MPATQETHALEPSPSDAEWLRSLRWSQGANGLVTASQRGDVEAFGDEVRADLRRRFGVKGSDPDRLAARFPRYEAVARDIYNRLLEDQEGPAVEVDDPASRLVRLSALLDGLRRWGGKLDGGMLASFWRDAWLETSEIASAPPEPSSTLEAVLSAEIVWASGILFDGQKGMASRRKEGGRRLFAELDLRTDTDGTPHADLLPILPEWLSAFVRSLEWAKAGQEVLWGASKLARFDALVAATATLTRADGHPSFSTRLDIRPLLDRAAKRSGLKSGAAARRLISRLRGHAELPPVPKPETRTGPRRSDRAQLPAIQSDWAALALCRTSWRREADLLAVAWGASIPAIEFSAFGRPVFAGEWGLRVRVDGEDVTSTSGWESVCWFSDRDADYLELQWTVDQNVSIYRQALLTRGDHQLFLTEAVSTPSRTDARIEVESTLPLAAGATAVARRPLREIGLDTGGLPLRALPIALPMNRLEQGTGSFEVDQDRLVLRQTGVGGVYSPLVLDWHPGRRRAPIDWRTLTVTEDHRRLGPSEAAAQRLRIDDRQLLVYRRMNDSKAMRAVLGYHHGAESMIGRFTKKGEVDPLVIVEE